MRLCYHNRYLHSTTERWVEIGLVRLVAVGPKTDCIFDGRTAISGPLIREGMSEFNLSEPQYHLARIVVDNDPGANNSIHALRDKLENGEEFGVIAMKYSTDRDTAPNGGDMGFVSESQLQEALRAITKLKPGRFSEIVPYDGDSARGKGIGGYPIYEVISREPPGQRELNDPRVQQLIRQRLREGHSQLLKDAYFDVLRGEAHVHNYLADQILGKTSP